MMFRLLRRCTRWIWREHFASQRQQFLSCRRDIRYWCSLYGDCVKDKRKFAGHNGMRTRAEVQEDIERHPFRPEDCSEPWVQGWLIALEWVLGGAAPGDSDKDIDPLLPTAHEVALARNREEEAE